MYDETFGVYIVNQEKNKQKMGYTVYSSGDYFIVRYITCRQVVYAVVYNVCNVLYTMVCRFLWL